MAEKRLLTQLGQQINQLPRPACYIVAYSGGLDSHVLLHAMAMLRDNGDLQVPLQAIHINHQLQRKSNQWANHCWRIARKLNIACDVVPTNVYRLDNESLEEAARRVRYATIAQHCPQQAMLLCAHHQQDQAETVLLQLLRGTGLKGLSGMPVCKSWEGGWLARPFLSTEKPMIEQYAEANQLNWVEDPSNTDLTYSRNYLRQVVFPQLTARWPQASRQFASSAMVCAKSDRLLSEWALTHLSDFKGTHTNTLSVKKLLAIELDQCYLLLRTWLSSQHIQLPSRKKLHHIYMDVLQAKRGASPCVTWSNIEIRRYRDDLYALTPQSVVDNQTELLWHAQSPLVLPNALGKIISIKQRGQGISLSAIEKEAGITVRFRREGEGQRIKKLFQQYGVAPWDRKQIPLFYLGDQLAGALGLWVNRAFAAKENEWGVVCQLQK